ncbi:hypothetical protein [Acetivibrio cellulolyticus]|uniref:hypothetical protein n=1 Tax=Acetivibrio cellulolyticus TaxID=35830 RepID=UPI0001E2BDA3|nr:hypothetical protein [Acetivibrio cellulolyticus]
MSNENEKKGLFERLTGGKKEKKKPCCCGFEVEEISEENGDNKEKQEPKEGKGNSCCK